MFEQCLQQLQIYNKYNLCIYVYTLQTKERFFTGLFLYLFSVLFHYLIRLFPFTSIFCDGNCVGYDDVSSETKAHSLGIRKVWGILIIPEKCKQCIYVSKQCLNLVETWEVLFVFSREYQNCLYFPYLEYIFLILFNENSSELCHNPPKYCILKMFIKY